MNFSIVVTRDTVVVGGKEGRNFNVGLGNSNCSLLRDKGGWVEITHRNGMVALTPLSNVVYAVPEKKEEPTKD